MKIIQISDLHLFATATETMDIAGFSVNTYQTFQKVRHALQQESDIDLIIVTGDIAQDPSKQAYQHIAKQLHALDAPVYCLAGNHDKPEYLKRFLNTGNLHSIDYLDTESWRIIFLDSSKPNCVAGHFSDEQLTKLAEQLDTHKPILIAMHHHPVPIHSQWMDEIGLQQAEKFINLIKQQEQVKAVIFGHIHQAFDETHHNIRFLGSISSCLQFVAQQDDLVISPQSIGYRHLNLQTNGNIDTYIQLVEQNN